MTKKEAKELTLKVWRYLAEHPECDEKSDVPDELYEKIEAFYDRCPLCHMFRSGWCKDCPLNKSGECCLEKDSVYQRWSMAYNDDKRKAAAERIVEIVSAWEPKETDG
jgi:hypothetical protein